MPSELSILLTLKDMATDSVKKFQGQISKLSGDINNASKKMALTNESIVKLGASLVGFNAIYRTASRAFNGMINYAKQSVEEYGKQIQVEEQLKVALGGVSQGLLDQATALQKQTTFSDDAIISAQTQLALFIKEEDQIKRLTPSILDFAAAKGMDLKSASDLVAKTIASETNSLSRYGIKVEGAANSVERMESAMSSLNDAFGGQARALAQTDYGKLQQQANALSDIQETLGKEILPAQIQWNNLMLQMAEFYVPKIANFLKSINPGSAVSAATAQTKQLDIYVKSINQLRTRLAPAESARSGISGASPALDAMIADLKSQISAYEKKRDALMHELWGTGSGAKGISGPDATGAPGTTAKGDPNAEWLRRQEEADAMMKKLMEASMNERAELEEEQRRQIMDAQLRVEEERIASLPDIYNRELQELQLKQDMEMLALGTNNTAKEELERAHQSEMDRLTEEHARRRTEERRREADDAERIQQQRIQSTEFATSSLISLGASVVSANEKNKERQRRIAITEAIIQGNLAGAYAIASVWADRATDLYTKIGMSIGVGAQTTAQTIMNISAMKRAATGTDFITQGPRLLLVGDNPSGRERVSVTPMGGGGSTTNNASTFNVTINGNASKDTIDYTIQELERFSKQYSRAKYEGLIR